MPNNQQWITRTLSHEQADALPYNFMFSPPIYRSLCDHYNTSDLDACLNLPMRMTGPNSIRPLYADPAKFGPISHSRMLSR